MTMSDSSEKRCRDCYYATKRTGNSYVCRKRYFDIDSKTCFKQREFHETSDPPEPYREENET